ncbi:hypothetical protein MC885_020772, partial [Smutsia gigantea]
MQSSQDSPAPDSSHAPPVRPPPTRTASSPAPSHTLRSAAQASNKTCFSLLTAICGSISPSERKPGRPH